MNRMVVVAGSARLGMAMGGPFEMRPGSVLLSAGSRS
jgi:hypothetical protein